MDFQPVNNDDDLSEESISINSPKPILSLKVIQSIERDMMRALFGSSFIVEQEGETVIDTTLATSTTVGSLSSKTTTDKNQYSIETLQITDVTEKDPKNKKPNINSNQNLIRPPPSFCEICCGSSKIHPSAIVGPYSSYSVCII